MRAGPRLSLNANLAGLPLSREKGEQIAAAATSTEMTPRDSSQQNPAAHTRPTNEADPSARSPHLALEKEADGGIRTLDPRFTRADWGPDELPGNQHESSITGEKASTEADRQGLSPTGSDPTPGVPVGVSFAIPVEIGGVVVRRDAAATPSRPKR
jgi:hypothetical protein